jgi:hypothetical protein
MSGIFGCGSRRNVAIFAASKPGLVAMLAKGGAAGHPALIGGDDMARLAPRASKLFAIARIGRKYLLRQQPMSFKLRPAAFMNHVPFSSA